MSIITIATSKGGAGKTTLAQVITGTAAKLGLRVAAIDADYNHSLADWVQRLSLASSSERGRARTWRHCPAPRKCPRHGP